MTTKRTTKDIETQMRAEASSSKMLLFYSFYCPHCDEINVYAKDFKKEVVLCSNTGCKKMIIINNFKDIA